MHLLDRLRIRRALALIVVVPMVIGSVSALVLAWSAQQDQRDAETELVEVELVIAARDLQSATTTEMTFYRGWAELAPLEAGEAFVLTAARAVLIEAVHGLSDEVLENSLSAPFDAEGRDAVDRLAGAIGAARLAFEQGDEVAVEAAAREADLVASEIGAIGDEVLERRGRRWLPINRHAIYVRSLASEVLVVTPLMLRAESTETERRHMAVMIDRTDRSFDLLLEVLSPDQRDRLFEAETTNDYAVDIRSRTADVGDGFEPISIAVLGRAMNGLLDSGSVLNDIRNESVDAVLADATAKAERAEWESRLLMGLAVVAVVVPFGLALAVGGRLSRRLDRVTDAAVRLSSGELGVRVDDIGGRDEVALLATAFDEISATITTGHEQISALADGRTDDPVLERELPGLIGHTLRLALRRLGNTTAELAHQASHDKLTGLLDRRGLQHGVESFDLTSGSTMILIDLDGFKAVNDDRGHSAGDAVLEAIAERLRTGVRADDLVARLGGDEFVIVITDSDGREVEQTIDRLVESIAAPIDWTDGALQVTASIGWTPMAPGEAFGTALHRADTAMYQAKRRGKAQAVRS